MQVVTPLYDTILNQEHVKEVKLSINNVEYGMGDLKNMETFGDLFGSTEPALGLAISREISVNLWAESSVIPRMAEMKPYVRLRSGDLVSEWIQKGVFFIDTREATPSGYLSIHGFDPMLKAEIMYPASSLAWPATDINVVREIAGKIGVQVDSRTVYLMNQSFSIPFPSAYTMREVLKGIAGIYGGSFIINDVGKLQLVCLWDKAEETFYLTDEEGNRLIVGGNKILLDSWRWE